MDIEVGFESDVGRKPDLKSGMQSVKQRAAQKMVSEVRKNASAQFNRTGKYADGWTSEVDGDDVVVYNEGERDSMSHLLENGHVVIDRNGVLHGDWSPGEDHIKPAFDAAQKVYLQAAEDLIDDVLKEW